METLEQNWVEVAGKISRVEKLEYTPTGKPVLEFLLAVTQKFLEKKSVGYFRIVVSGPEAEDKAQDLKIGKKISVEGTLWSRAFKNRRGESVHETKILAEKIV